MLKEEEIDVMEHALGIEEAWRRRGMHYKRHGKQYIQSYRNYFQTEEKHKPYYDIWKNLVKKGFSDSWVKVFDGKEYLYFDVNDEGIKQLQKQQNYIIKFI